MTPFDEIKMKISPGDEITSKRGVLSGSPLTGKYYLWRKAKYRGAGLWQIIGEKEEVDVTINERQNADGENKPGCFGAIGLPGKRNDPECPCAWKDRCRQSQEDY